MAGPTKRKDGGADSGGKNERKESTGRGRFIIDALNGISSCYMGSEILIEMRFHSHHIRPEQLFSVLLLYIFTVIFYENLVYCNYSIKFKTSMDHH